MDEKSNINININQNEPLNTADNNLPNPQVVEINRHKDLIKVLRQIADNTRGRNGADDQ